MKYKHVVFDLDGTLLDSDRSLFLAWRDTFRQFGKYCSDEEIYASFGKTRWDIFGMFGVNNPEEFWEAWKKNYKRLSADVGFFDGVNDLLGELKERGIKTGLVTSRAREELDAYFSDLLKGVFDYEVCADDTKKHKPDPEPLLYYAAGGDRAERLRLYRRYADGRTLRQCGGGGFGDYRMEKRAGRSGATSGREIYLSFAERNIGSRGVKGKRNKT